MKRSDLSLVCRMARGDRKALAELYDRYAANVYGVAVELTDSEEAAELTDEVFRSAWKYAGFYQQRSRQVPTWLLKMCRDLAVQDRRIDQGRLPESVHLESPVSKADVIDAVNRLPEKQREVLRLLFFQGLTRRQVAEALGEPVRNVTFRTQSAFFKLKRTIGGGEQDR
ncbi:RNA polymerase sigma-70 factor, ECF subfamily [Melghirimyces thermohalophilus]|uniref:RNA polymerase sigma-70 factor, ECF subfamily n=1 Tax=Melghirimyces thermohalophilus TaxID=1236220 RepID=A0A1G6RA79_9BACL|nr:sigma-70 family RNA polymerase sigma factor [Melghirimyces thermohalophilus]SDD01341.1 RNA polymerase sigma-70 factor, ECF subfamily [Melghirimyces thermohalophilus]